MKNRRSEQRVFFGGCQILSGLLVVWMLAGLVGGALYTVIGDALSFIPGAISIALGTFAVVIRMPRISSTPRPGLGTFASRSQPSQPFRSLQRLSNRLSRRPSQRLGPRALFNEEEGEVGGGSGGGSGGKGGGGGDGGGRGAQE